MAYPSTSVARLIFEVANRSERPLTPLELVKLTYLSHGWHLAFTGEPLVSETVQAWQYGPVYPELYHAIKHFRASPVMNVPKAGTEVFGTPEMSDVSVQIVESVFNAYKSLNGVQLSALTHQQGTPWDKTWDGARNKMIPNELIKAHFDELNGRRAA